jgi:tRNA(Ile)-lysidine synthase
MAYLNSLLEEIEKYCQQLGFVNTYWVGFSGGMDSQVLLSALLQLQARLPLKIKAIHINHQLSSDADKWAAHCSKFCNDHAIELHIKKMSTRPQKSESIEAWARQGRYKIFKNCLSQNDILLTAHHADDQSETLINQMMRGAGPKGLASMPVLKNFACGFLLRPLLHFPRSCLQDYAEQQHLTWVQDESNKNIKFSRNFIRHRILPVLQEHWPQYPKLLGRVARNCADAQNLLEEYLREDVRLCAGNGPQTLSITKLKNLPSRKKLNEILLHVLSAAQDRMPLVTWGEVEIRRYKNDLYGMPAEKKLTPTDSFFWPNLAEVLRLPQGVLSAEPVLGRGLSNRLKNCTVKFRAACDTCVLPGRKFHHKLKKLLQAMGVPPWLRDTLPLIFYGEELVAVVGYFIADQYRAKNLEEGYELIFKRSIIELTLKT